MPFEFKAQKVVYFTIPAFVVNTGDFVVIKLGGGSVFGPSLDALVAKIMEKDRSFRYIHRHIIPEFHYGERTVSRFFKRLFFPRTVAGYIHRFGNATSSMHQKIYATDHISPAHKIKDLNNMQQKLLMLYVALSWTNNIIFDLSGIGPIDLEPFMQKMTAHVKPGGTAILIDTINEFEKDCTTYVEAEFIPHLLSHKIA